MSASRNNYFFEELTSISGSTYIKDGPEDFDFNFAARNVKIAVVGGEVAYRLTGPDNTSGKDEGKIIPGDGLVEFNGLEAHRITFREVTGTVSRLRIWAWK